MYSISQKIFRDKKTCFFTIVSISLYVFISCGQLDQVQDHERNTKVSIVGEAFHINGTPTYEGQTWTTSYGGEYTVEGLLMNARLVQGVFDDLNTDTRGQWVYPDTKEWDPDRNTQEFINAMATWREHGLLGFTLNLQGGCPYGYCSQQRWDNSAFAPDGSLRDDFMDRTERVLDRADELGMVVILGYYYFGQDGNLEDEAAVIRAVENATEWVLEKGYTNVIIEINNECNVSAYDHDIVRCDRVHELIDLAKDIEIDGRSLYVSTSMTGGRVPLDNIVASSDFVLIHGNGVQDPARIVEISQEVRDKDVYSTMPLVNNEDDIPWRNPDQGWGEDGNNFVASVKSYTGWGYFDFRLPDEDHDYNLGFQSVPVNWQLSSERKRDFFDLLAEVTGSPGTPKVDLEFSRELGEQVSVVIDVGDQANVPIQNVELLINNEVITTTEQTPYEFSLDEYGYDFRSGEHWIKARVRYNSGEHEVIIESPYYRNPWWPYGGPPR